MYKISCRRSDGLWHPNFMRGAVGKIESDPNPAALQADFFSFVTW